MNNRQTSLHDLIRNLWHNINTKQRHQIIFTFFLMLISGIAEMVSLGMLIPFLGILSNTDKFLQSNFFHAIRYFLNLQETCNIALLLSLCFCLAVIIAGGIRLATFSCTAKLSHDIGKNIEHGLYKKTLCQPYFIHITKNTSEILTNIEKAAHISNAVLSILNIAIGIIITLCIITTLLIINAIVAITCMLALGGFYLGITTFTRKRLFQNSLIIAKDRTKRTKIVQESFGGIRDIILDNAQNAYIHHYNELNTRLHQASASTYLYTNIPRIFIETSGIILIVVVAYFINTTSNFINAIPLLGAMALGAQRLLPTLQQIYQSWTFLKSQQASIQEVLVLFNQSEVSRSGDNLPAAWPFLNTIEFQNTGFYYIEKQWIFRHLNLRILKGEKIGIIGTTGNGKSSLLDLFMGLLLPREGTILIDGKELTPQNMRSWQRIIAHVPQNIYLADTTIAENIAIGIPIEDIDMTRVQQVSRIAQIADFIETQPAGYLTAVGERGIRLSGGQRQRIGIARALYKQALLLVLDEATSALDNETEKKLVSAINEASNNLTMIMVSHRPSILKHCDKIFNLEKGGKLRQLNHYEHSSLINIREK